MGIVSIKSIKHQVILLLKSLKRLKLVCSFKKNSFITPINSASCFFLIWLLDGALHYMDQSNVQCVFYMLYCFSFMCWAVVFWPTRCSLSNGLFNIIFNKLTFTIAYFASWVHVLSFKRDKKLNFLVFQLPANRNRLLVNLWNFLTKSFDLASCFSQ